MKLRVAVLISGEGTNLQAILDEGRKPGCPYEVVLVISNREEAHGLERARRFGVRTEVVSHLNFPSRDAFDQELMSRLQKENCGLIALAGFMRLLGKKFVEQYRGKVMNIHPSLLPAFPGVGAIEKAWRQKAKVTGVTVHFVDQGVDTGPVILQQEVPVEEGEDLERLTKRIHAVEHQLYPRAIRLFAEGRLKL